jgi:hypothetical protein
MAQARGKGWEKRLSILRLPRSRGAPFEARDHAGRTPLSCEVADSVPASTILPLSAAAGQPEKMRLLLEYGADPAQVTRG